MRDSLVFSIYKIRLQAFKDIISIIILFVLTFFIVYFIPHIFSKLFFILLFGLFLFSKKDYFWFAYFFILAQGPGYFFADFSGISQYRLPLYTVLPSISFIPSDLFVIFALLKALIKGKKVQLKLKKPLALIAFYISFSFITTSFIFGTEIDILARGLRWVFYYSLIISFSFLVTKKEEVFHFIHLIIPFVFFIFFTQIYYVKTGTEFIDIFNPGFRGLALNSVTKEFRPLMGGVLIAFFSFIFSLFLLKIKDYNLSKIYLYLIISISCISVFISATRIWFVIFLFILLGYILISKMRAKTLLSIVLISSIIIVIMVSTGVFTSDYLVSSAWGRVKQVFRITEGGIYSIDTGYSRFAIQFPVLLQKIKESPLMGFGFSSVTLQYYDNDLGFFNTILIFGILGFSLFLYFFIIYFSVILSSLKRLTNSNPLRTSIKILPIAWGGMLIGYFSTWDFFTLYFQKVFFVAIIIAISEFFMRQADKEELLVKQQKLSTGKK